MSLPVHLYTQSIVGGNSGVSGDMSAPINSSSQNLDEAVSYSVQAVITGTMTGTVSLQASNDVLSNNLTSPINWTTIPETISSVNNTGTYMVNVEFPAYSWVRLIYTPISGTGTMTANINGKRR